MYIYEMNTKGTLGKISTKVIQDLVRSFSPKNEGFYYGESFQATEEQVEILVNHEKKNFYDIKLISSVFTTIEVSEEIKSFITYLSDPRIRTQEGLKEDLKLKFSKSSTPLRGDVFIIRAVWWRSAIKIVFCEKGIINKCKPDSYPEDAMYKILYNNYKEIYSLLGGKGSSSFCELNKIAPRADSELIRHYGL